MINKEKLLQAMWRTKRNRMKNTFYFDFSAEKLHTKNTIKSDPTTRSTFISQIKEKFLNEAKIQYQCPVIVSLIIEVYQINPPPIHAIAKCYIDFLFEENNNFLPLKDDNLIKHLYVRYIKSKKDSRIRFQIFPEQLLKTEMKLLKQCRRSYYNMEVECDEFEELTKDSSQNQYYSHLENKDEYIKKNSKEDFEYYKLFYQKFYQENFFKRSYLNNEDIYQLYKNQKSIDAKENSALNLNILLNDLNKITTLIIENEKLEINLGDYPQKTKVFNEQLDKYFSNKDFLKPLLIPVSVTFIYVVPKNFTKEPDLDKFAIDYFEFLKQKLSPSSNQINSMQESSKRFLDGKGLTFNKRTLLPEIEILSYNVIRLIKGAKKCSLKMNLHNNYYTGFFPDYIFEKCNKYYEFLSE